MKNVKTMMSKDTRKHYRVIREYKHVVLVTRADRKKTMPFTMPRERLVESKV